jgi:TetR/AcrR family transcriptional repressor of nem operon
MENKREELLKTAYRLIRTKGFDSFSYNDLSKEVGITKASIHYYFPSKEDLGMAICDRIMQQLEWLQSTAAGQYTVQEKFDLYVKTICAQAQDDLICPISSLQAEYNVVPDRMKQKIKEITEKELQVVGGILQEGLDQGTFHFQGDAMAQAALLVTACKSATLYSRVLQQDLMAQIIAQFVRQMHG